MANTSKPAQVSSSSSSSLDSVSTATSVAVNKLHSSYVMTSRTNLSDSDRTYQVTAGNTPVTSNVNVGMSIDDPVSMPLPVLSDLEGVNMASSIFTPNILSMQQAPSSLTSNYHPATTPTHNTTTPTPLTSTSMDFSNMDGINIHFPLEKVSSNSTPNVITSSNAILNTHPQFDHPVLPVAPSSVVSNGSTSSTSAISDEAIAQIVSNTSVPEFLYQLTKMLTDDHRDIIEWSNSKIEVHNPHRLESEVLNKYFRHSKYASFQRQLNYFGFRKLAGKGKMAPCSYINENATNDLRSLLRMKRKTSATTKGGDSKSGPNNGHDAKGKKRSISIGVGGGSTSGPSASASDQNLISRGGKRSRGSRSKDGEDVGGIAAKIAVGKGVRHQLNGYLRNKNPSDLAVPCKVTSSGGSDTLNMDPSSIAKSVVGKGVAHHYAMQTGSTVAPSQSSSTCNSLDGFRDQGTGNKFTFLDPPQLGMGIDYIENNLSELQNNYQSSLNACAEDSDNDKGKQMHSALQPTGKPLQRDSSLVALAMIPSLSSVDIASLAQTAVSTEVEQTNINADHTENDDKGTGMMTFIDFP